MALDNPSYFTIPGGATASAGNRNGRFSLIRKHVRMGGTPSTTAASTNSSSNKVKKGERYSVLPTSLSGPTGPNVSVSASATTLLPESSTSTPSSEGNNFRRSFRSLIQANGFDSPIQTQMFVLGMPRPSDIAPPGVQQASHSIRKNHHRNASTGKPYRMPSSEMLTSSRSPKASNRCQDSGTRENCSLMDDRYYNAMPGSSFLQTGRRHSIGAYFNRKTSCVSRVETQDQIQEETSFCTDSSARVDFKFAEGTPNHGKKPESPANHRKKSCCCQIKKGGKIGMEDIVIISSNRSQAANLWVTYLKTCFDQIRKNRNKPPFRILSVEVEDFGDPGHPLPALEEKLKNAKLVIFIICPVFSDHVFQYPEQCGNICKHIRPDGVLAMLLGIGESNITNVHQTALPNYSQWKRMESVKDRDEKFVGDFLGAAMDIISKNIVQNNQPTEKGSFMLMPKKVNKSQNKVLVLLNDPIAKEDTMRVTVIRNNEVFEIPSVKKRNPYTLIFRMPEEFLSISLLVSIRVERNGVDLGTKLLKCESQLYAMAQILKSCDSPVEFMCQALNIVPYDKDKLDDFLMSSFQRNVPPNFNLLQTTGLGQLHRGVISKDEFPTLLHFAARFGLEKLCWALLECPGGELACDVRNVCELTPSELAESMGHTKLANALCGYMQMTEFTSVYTFLKGMSDEKNIHSKSDSSDDYLNPRPLSETYQVPPSPRPLAQLYSHPPFGYMQMQSPKSSISSSMSDTQETSRNFSSSKERLLFRKSSEDSLRRSDGEQHTFKCLRDNTGNGTQDELIEIINDFKNNVFTISEVEKLVEDWRNRNDVQQSFKEKQEQLNKMREEYERVQQKLKEEMKTVGRVSPLERIRNFFRSKSKESKSSDGQDGGGDKKSRQMENLLPHRPSSGLSIQSSSSSSSGRLSTGSHCSGASLGDSGTHSDAESERKSASTSGSFCNSFKMKDGMDNYDVPPPNPVSLANGKPKTTNGIFNYDIPPSANLLTEYGVKQQWDNESCLSCESQTKDVNYYNLIGKDVPIPNESTLHSPIIKAASRNCLKALEETVSSEYKTEESNCYEYINLPGTKGKEDSSPDEGETIEGEKGECGGGKEGPNLEIKVPDYVNVENGIK